MMRKTFLRTMVSVGLAAFLILAFTVSGVQAQGKFPSRPMTIICPWGAGGGTDAVARMLAVLMEKDLGQPVNVVNRTGGSGAVGHTAAATAGWLLRTVRVSAASARIASGNSRPVAGKPDARSPRYSL